MIFQTVGPTAVSFTLKISNQVSIILFKKFFLFLFFILISCADDADDTEPLYSFPSLPQKQLIELKSSSDKIEGFFITTDLSDLDSSWAKRGFYLYVCIRFLNDSTVNNKLKKSAIPLLVQVSNSKNKPTAESVMLFHPQTMKSEDGNGIFYYEERQKFQLTDSPIAIRGKEYNIFDMQFNSQNKITHISFIKKGTELETLERVVFVEAGDMKEDGTEDKGENEHGGDDGSENNQKDPVLEVTAFAKQFSDSCDDWPILNYRHSKKLPDYLQVQSSDSSTTEEPSVVSDDSPVPQSSTTEIQTLAPVPEDAPYIPVEKAE